MSDNYWNEINQNTTDSAKGFLRSIIYNESYTYKKNNKTYTRYINNIAEIITPGSTFIASPQRNTDMSDGSDNVVGAMFIGAISTSESITIKNTTTYSTTDPNEDMYTTTKTHTQGHNYVETIDNVTYYISDYVGLSLEPSPRPGFYIPQFNNVSYWGVNFVKISKKYNGDYTKYKTKFEERDDNLRYWISSMPIVDLTANIGNQIIQIQSNWDNELEKTTPKLNTDWTLAIDGTKSPLYKLKWNCTSITKNDIARIRIGFGGYDDISGKVSIHKWQLVDYRPSHFNTNYAQINNAVWGEIAEIVSPLASLAAVYIAVQLEYYATPTVLPTDYSSIMFCELFKNQKNGHMYGNIGFLEKDDNGLYSKVTTGDGSTFTVKDGEDGSKIVTSDDDDGYSDDKDDDENDNNTSDVSSGIGVLTTTFKMSKDRLQQLGRFLWGSNIFDNFSLICNNPIENIISCKSIPLSLNGTTQKIILGNVDTGVNGDKVSNNFTNQNIGSIAITEKYHNFLDYAPYTNVIIYLPYVGFKELDTNLVMGKTLSISYTVDIITGGCLCQIKSNNVKLYEFNGNMGIDIPITASNRAQVEAGYISSGIGIASSAASGNIVGAVTSLINSAESQYHYASTSSPNPMCVASTNRTCYVILDRPTYQTLKSFNHTRGKKCYLTKTINTLKGYTICDEHIDLSGIRATDSEKEELIKILSSGFFVN
jgi:hypothetical protein